MREKSASALTRMESQLVTSFASCEIARVVSLSCRNACTRAMSEEGRLSGEEGWREHGYGEGHILRP